MRACDSVTQMLIGAENRKPLVHRSTREGILVPATTVKTTGMSVRNAGSRWPFSVPTMPSVPSVSSSSMRRLRTQRRSGDAQDLKHRQDDQQADREPAGNHSKDDFDNL